ncbi:SCAN domain-containing [Labeo rohita]|uniref:SCAN domain-containing n=1 Tax=Labeo rohita TaxID=84645 RepID=A0A498LAM3_LABRO|nr:SCAN domain-containing [Labeo rohita]RXN13094.1 SCAN domain-containing [Labeo rohita]
MKPSRMKEHLMKIHPDKADKERSFFQALKEKHGRRVISSLFTRTSSQNDSGLIASYNISLLIAKCGQSFTIGEKLVIPVIKEVISTVMERDPTQVLKSIPLSNDTVARRINEMGADTEEQLCAILRDSPFSLQLDETTTSDNNALLMAYVRYRASDSDEIIVEYLEKVDAALGERMSSSRCDIMYHTDFFEKMNEATLKLQGKDVTLVQCKAVIHSLTSRLDLYRQSIGRRHFAHFPQLTKVAIKYVTTDRTPANPYSMASDVHIRREAILRALCICLCEDERTLVKEYMDSQKDNFLKDLENITIGICVIKKEEGVLGDYDDTGIFY